MGEGAVFAVEGDDVGDGAEGGEGGGFEEIIFEGLGDFGAAGIYLADCPGEFEGDAGAAEVGGGIGGIRIVGGGGGGGGWGIGGMRMVGGGGGDEGEESWERGQGGGGGVGGGGWERVGFAPFV